jgi:hypothetical protein
MKRSLLIALLLVSMVAVFGLSSVDAQPPRLIDHYLIYHTVQQFSVFPGQVQLIDQFGGYDADSLFTFVAFGNPVDKNGEGILDPMAHLSVYEFPIIPTDVFRIGVTDQFGYNVWWVKEAHYLLLPALKDQPGGGPPEKDHYLCYDVVQGPTLNVTVQLVDQWGGGSYILGRAVLWCNPVEKIVNGIPYPIINPGHHLAVYEFLNPNDIPITGFSYLDQFMGEFNEAFAPWLLAVPAQKQFPVPVKESTWGHIKSLYQ